MLGAIIEKVSGERFDVYIEKYVTGPLNLNCSFNVNQLDSNLLVPLYKYNPSTKRFKLMPEAYKSYKDYLDNYKLASYTPLLSPTGGMKISAEGLAKYMMMHIQGGRNNNSRIISKKSEKLIRQGWLHRNPGMPFHFREYKGTCFRKKHYVGKPVDLWTI